MRAIRRLVDAYSADRILLSKEMVTLYEDIQEFWVATREDGEVLGCGALHVMWEDLAEVRTLATDPSYTGRGVGRPSSLGSWTSPVTLGFPESSA